MALQQKENILPLTAEQEAELAKLTEGKVKDDYTNWTELTDAIATAKAGLRSEFADNLRVAKEAETQLIPVTFEKTELINLQRELDNRKQSDYTVKSWNYLQDVIARAKATTLQSKYIELIPELDIKTLVAVKPTIGLNEGYGTTIIVSAGEFDPSAIVWAKDYENKALTPSYTASPELNINKAGTYLLTYSAQDAEGHKTDNIVITLIIKEKPTLGYVIGDDEYVSTKTGSYITKETVIISDNEGTIYEMVNGKYVEYDGRKLTDGTYTMKIITTDGVESDVITFTIDTKKPLVSIEDFDTINIGETITFSDASGIKKVTIRDWTDDNAEPETLTLEGNSYKANKAGYWEITVYDNANWSTTIVFEVK